MYLGSTPFTFTTRATSDLREPEQVTGILGFKAYLCLDRSRVVGTVLVVIQIAWLAVAVRDATETDSERQLSGEVFHT